MNMKMNLWSEQQELSIHGTQVGSCCPWRVINTTNCSLGFSLMRRYNLDLWKRSCPNAAHTGIAREGHMAKSYSRTARPACPLCSSQVRPVCPA